MVKKRTRVVKGSIRFHEKLGFWKFLVVVLVVALILLVVPGSEEAPQQQVLSKDIVEARVKAFISAAMEPGSDVTVHRVIDRTSVYELDVTVGNESAKVYSSKDGRYLFPGALDMSDAIPLSASPTGSNSKVSVEIGDDAVLGDDEAPVTIIEFSDYECPFCRKFWSDTLPLLKREYIDRGLVKFVFRDMPASYHPDARAAAEASECAHEQGAFWEYHDKLFENSDSLSTSKFTSIAAELGLDVVMFTGCFNDRKYSSEVMTDASDAAGYGVQGTPSFFVNGIPVSGALPFQTFKELIDRELGYS